MQEYIRITLLLLLGLGVQGCASYVNIPADYHKDPAINTIDLPPTPRAIAAAVEFALNDFPPAQRPFAIALPTPASQATWNTVLAGRPNATRFDDLNPDRILYDVRSIRIRGHYAQVDILLPESNDGRPVLEVHLEGGLDGWTVTSARRWSKRVLDVKPQSIGRQPQHKALNPIRSGSDLTVSDTSAPRDLNGVLMPIRHLSGTRDFKGSHSPDETLVPIRTFGGATSPKHVPAEPGDLNPVRIPPARRDRP